MAFRFTRDPNEKLELPPDVQKDMERVFDALKDFQKPAIKLSEMMISSGILDTVRRVADAVKENNERMQIWREAVVLPSFKQNTELILARHVEHHPELNLSDSDTERLATLVADKMKASIGIGSTGGTAVTELFVDGNLIYRYPKEKLFFRLTDNRLSILRILSVNFQKGAVLAKRLQKSEPGLRQTLNEMDDAIVSKLFLGYQVIIGDPAYGYKLNDDYKITFLDHP